MARPVLPAREPVSSGGLAQVEERLRKHIGGRLGEQRSIAWAPEGLRRAAAYLKE